MPGGGKFKQLLDEVTVMLYEKVDNNPDDYRFSADDPEEIKVKMKYIDKHQKRAEEFNLQKEILDCISHRALGFYKQNNMEKFEELSHLQIEMATELKNEMRLRQAYSNLGVINKMSCRFGAALEFYNMALELATKRNERWCLARLHNNIANIFEFMQDYEKAMEHHNQRLEIAQELGDLDGISKACCSLAAMYHAMGDIEKTIECYERVQDSLRKKLKNFDTLADDAAGSDDDFVDFGADDEEEGEDEEEEGGGGKKKKRCVVM